MNPDVMKTDEEEEEERMKKESYWWDLDFFRFQLCSTHNTLLYTKHQRVNFHNFHCVLPFDGGQSLPHSTPPHPPDRP